jgi:hypothetical protein
MRKAKGNTFLSESIDIKKLCCTGTFVEQGEISGRKHTQEWKHYEEWNITGIGDYHVGYQADYYILTRAIIIISSAIL